MKLKFFLNGSLILPESFDYLKTNIKRVHFFYPTYFSEAPTNAEVGSPKADHAELLYLFAVRKISPDVLLIGTMFDGCGEPFIIPPVEMLKGYCRVASIVYDFIPLQSAKQYRPTLVHQMSYKFSLIRLSSCDVLLCISEYVKRQCQILIPGVRAEVIYGAAASSFKDFINDTNFARESFILYAGGLDERKNVATLLEAYSQLTPTLRERFPLRICCNNDSTHYHQLISSCRKLGIVSNVDFDLTPSDHQLAMLYRRCRLFIFPSKSEGLGMPVLEAMSFGAPILSSNSTSLSEIYNNEKGQFSPNSPSQLAQLIKSVILDDKLLEELQEYSLEQSKQFTWEQTARRCIEGLAGLSLMPKIQLPTLVETIEHMGFYALDTEEERINTSKALVNSYFNFVYYDISEFAWTSAKTGIQRVVANVLRYLPKTLPVNFKLVPISYHQDGIYRAVEFDNEAGKWIWKGSINPKFGDIYLGLDLCATQVVGNIEQLKTWKRKGVKFVFCVYDLVFEKFPEFVANQETVKVLHTWLCEVLKLADGIIADSETVSNEVQQWAKANGLFRPDVKYDFYHCASNFQSNMPIQSFNSSSLVEDKKSFTFITVSTIEPRKGYVELLKTFQRYIKNGGEAKLVIVGRKGWNSSEIINLINETPQVKWYSNCDDKTLISLYREADCFVFASHYEGFGIAVVEAAQFGLPLLLRDIPVFREIAKDNAIYFSESEHGKSLFDQMRYCVENRQSLPLSKAINPLTWESTSEMIVKSLRKMEMICNENI